MGNLSSLSRLVSVVCLHSKQTTRGVLWTELCQLGIFSKRPKRSGNHPLLQISVNAGFANQLETHLSQRTFMQTEIVHCSLLLRTSIGGRWDKINCCHVYYVGLVKDASFKTVISEVRVLSKQWRDVQEYHNLCHYHRQGCVWKIFESSFNTAEWIKTTSTLVYYGGLVSADWIILEYSGPSSLKAKVTSKGERARRWRFNEVSLGHRRAALYRARSDRTWYAFRCGCW